MPRIILSAAAILLAAAGPATAAEITGQYVEARTCDVFTGACFANADTGIAGKHAVLVWRVDRGSLDATKLDGLSVVAVVAAEETLGTKQHRAGRSVLLVDEKASAEQREALVKLAKKQAGDVLGDVIAVRSAPVSVDICPCTNNSCAKVSASDLKLETRCLNKDHDRGCGNDCDYFPPLTKGVQARAAMAVEHAFTGKDFRETWSDAERRGAYVGTFSAR
jgi:Protein of unknown function (DUF1326)